MPGRDIICSGQDTSSYRSYAQKEEPDALLSSGSSSCPALPGVQPHIHIAFPQDADQPAHPLILRMRIDMPIINRTI